MAESHSSQLLAAMDRLWFHHIILSAEPSSVLSFKTTSQSFSSSSSESPCWEGHYASTNFSTSSISQDDCNTETDDRGLDNRVGRKRTSRPNLLSNKCRSQSSSPSIQRPCKSLNLSMKKGKKLQKFLSCSTLHDLELEEVKGFLDLGFQFEREQLSPRTMSVVPGLQRIGGNVVTVNEKLEEKTFQNIEDESEEKKTGVIESYLSEAWMVKRPDSPLLRLRMARVSRAEDMKKCLKLWAKTVASTMKSDQ